MKLNIVFEKKEINAMQKIYPIPEIKAESMTQPWGSMSVSVADNGDIKYTADIEVGFIVDLIEVFKPFVDMAKGLIPSIKGLITEARTKMTKWSAVENLIDRAAPDLYERNHGDIKYVAEFTSVEWVDVDASTKKLKECVVHRPVYKRSSVEEILAAHPAAKFYLITNTDDKVTAKEVTSLEVFKDTF